ncbi:MAG TPA: hypothetical protein VGM37_14300 [Armatimonadota bacterium]
MHRLRWTALTCIFAGLLAGLIVAIHSAIAGLPPVVAVWRVGFTSVSVWLTQANLLSIWRTLSADPVRR